MKRSPSVIVVGGGVAGLAVAHELAAGLADPRELVCLDAAARAGGSLQSRREDGFLYEWAANGFLEAPATLALVQRLGLEDRLVRARQEACRRFLWRRGRLHELPLSPPALLRSRLLSVRGRLRLLGEPFVRRHGAGAPEESIHAFASRRLGREAAAVLADALATGVWAGDVRRLSLAAAFPEIRAMEARHGSLLRALLASRRGAGGSRPRLTSFQEGMQELTDSLAAALGPRLRLGAAVTRLAAGDHGGFHLHLRAGPPRAADAVVLACPAAAAAAIVADLDGALARELKALRTAPLAVVHLGWAREASLPPREAGFGFLVPRAEGLRTLGTLWSSEMFAGRAPRGCILDTTLIGGAHDPQAVSLDDDALVRLVREEAHRTTGLGPDPYFVRVLRHRIGIPQYELGHLDRLAVIERRLAVHPGLWLAGAAYHGVSVNALIAAARSVAAGVLKYLAARQP